MKSLSNELSDFLKFLTDCEKDCNFYADKLTEEEKLTQDILHKIELEDIKYAERSKLATQLQTNRRSRRAYKDRMEELQPIANFVKENKKFINGLQETLGKVRKQEDYHKNRTYYPRVMKEREK